MATLHTNALRSHAGWGPQRQARGSGGTDALHGSLERQLLLLRGVLTASTAPATAPALASEEATTAMHSTGNAWSRSSSGATDVAMHSPRTAWSRGSSEATDVEELLYMKSQLAEKLACGASEANDVEELMCMKSLLAEKLAKPFPGLRRPPFSNGGTRPPSEQAKTLFGLRLSKMALRTPNYIEDDLGCRMRSLSMSSSPQQSPRLAAKVLIKDGLAYVVR